MRILLDECVPRKLAQDLPGHYVRHVREHGWASKLDGALLRAAEKEFDVLLTVDRNLVHQQNLAALGLSLVVLVCYNNSLVALRELVPELRAILQTVSPGQVIYVPRDQAIRNG